MAQHQTLPEDEQDRAAEATLTIYETTRSIAEQIDGIRHAMGQADKGGICERQTTAKDFRRRTMNIRVTENAADDLGNIKARIAR